MEQPCYELNINIQDAINPKWQSTWADPKHPSGYVWLWYNDDAQKIFNLEWIKYMESLGLVVKNGAMFFRPRTINFEDGPHIDTGKHRFTISHYGINFLMDLSHIIGIEKSSTNYVDDSTMAWYELDERPIETVLSNNIKDRPSRYLTASEHYDKEIYRALIGDKCFLVDTSIPHHVRKSLSGQPRLAISIRNSVPGDNDVLTYSDAVRYFRENKLIND